MATKPQAKAAIDNGATLVKADIDNIVPVGTNIKDGNISFGPFRFLLILDAEGSFSGATTLMNALVTNLTAVGRAPIVSGNQKRRKSDQATAREIFVVTALATYRIVNF